MSTQLTVRLPDDLGRSLKTRLSTDATKALRVVRLALPGVPRHDCSTPWPPC